MERRNNGGWTGGRTVEWRGGKEGWKDGEMEGRMEGRTGGRR